MIPAFRDSPAKTLMTLALVGLVAACARKPDVDDKPVVVQPKPAENTACPQKVEARFEAIREAQAKWYTDHGAPVPSKTNQAQLKIGSNDHAVMLVHGFISSPAAMEDLAVALHDKSGDTVFSVLLTGYGSDAHAANEASTDDWRQSVTDAQEALKLCFPHITIVAHSLGGALVTEAIQSKRLVDINKLVFLAPYYKLEQAWPALLIEAINGGIADIDVQTLQERTGTDPYGYLPLKRPKPGEPAPFLPLQAMGKVIDLQKKFESDPQPMPELHVLLAESEADPIINGGFAAQYLNKITKNFERVTYEKDEKIGHSIETAADNPKFDELVRKIQDFVDNTVNQ